MKFVLKGPFKENIYSLMRGVGYFFQGEKDEELAFSRPARGYPRFHIYLKKEGNDLILNLHLDQKKPSYKGTPAHSAEYKDTPVKEEKERIKEIIMKKSV